MEIKYEFIFDDGRNESIDLVFSESDFSLKPFHSLDELWTRLDFHQCEACPLDAANHEWCPIALNLSYVLSRFRLDMSFTTVLVRSTTADRVTEKKGPLENGLCSVMGLIMATSGCPILDIFKPMAFTHLPFANDRETMFRAVSAYLAAQFVKVSKGKQPDWTLSNFVGMYKSISKINGAFADRLRSMSEKDATVNALILLDVFAQFGSFLLKNNWLKEVEPLFAAHLRD